MKRAVRSVLILGISLTLLLVLIYQFVVPLNLQKYHRVREAVLTELSAELARSDIIIVDEDNVRGYWRLREGRRGFIVEVQVDGYRFPIDCMVLLSADYRPLKVIVLRSNESPGYNVGLYETDFTGKVFSLEEGGLDGMTGASYTMRALQQASQRAAQFMSEIRL